MPDQAGNCTSRTLPTSPRARPPRRDDNHAPTPRPQLAAHGIRPDARTVELNPAQAQADTPIIWSYGPEATSLNAAYPGAQRLAAAVSAAIAALPAGSVANPQALQRDAEEVLSGVTWRDDLRVQELVSLLARTPMLEGPFGRNCCASCWRWRRMMCGGTGSSVSLACCTTWTATSM
ncbi:hypothetical protein NKH18_15070 [Streptomyces sp. M10(2022)]